DYRLGQAAATRIQKRETQLLRQGSLPELSIREHLHNADAVRWLARLVAYPTAEDLDISYSIVVVATRSAAFDRSRNRTRLRGWAPPNPRASPSRTSANGVTTRDTGATMKPSH